MIVFIQALLDLFNSHTVPQPASWQAPAGGPPLAVAPNSAPFVPI